MIPVATREQLEFHKLLILTAEAAHSEASRKGHPVHRTFGQRGGDSTAPGPD